MGERQENLIHSSSGFAFLFFVFFVCVAGLRDCAPETYLGAHVNTYISGFLILAVLPSRLQNWMAPNKEKSQNHCVRFHFHPDDYLSETLHLSQLTTRQ